MAMNLKMKFHALTRPFQWRETCSIQIYSNAFVPNCIDLPVFASAQKELPNISQSDRYTDASLTSNNKIGVYLIAGIHEDDGP